LGELCDRKSLETPMDADKDAPMDADDGERVLGNSSRVSGQLPDALIQAL
jgi:hypothetical protein